MQPRTQTLALRRAVPMTLIAMILALLAGAAVYFAIANSASAGTGITPNPTLSSSCGVDMVIVIDRSTSIDSTELSQMKTAMNGFVNAFLPATPTEIAVVQFGTQAQLVTGFSDNAATLTTAINGIALAGSPTQYTNWANALNTARDLFPNRGKPQLIVFSSDGNPTARFGYDAFGPVDIDVNDEPTMLAAAIPEANAAKAAGSRIIALGIGNDLDVSNLEDISSADATITSDFNTLAADLSALADDLCGGTITVHKVIDVDGNTGTTGDQSDGSGWTFNANVTSGSSTPSSGQTDGAGQLNFDITLGGDNTASVDIVETLQGGFTFISASCSGGDDNGTQGANSVNGIDLSSDDIVSCTFYNRPETVITPSPTPPPTPSPTPPPTPTPTNPPTQAPTPTPTNPPTQAPTPTNPPTQAPTPTNPPTQAPTPTNPPTQAPTPTNPPTQAPTAAPATQAPTPAPTSLASTATPAALPVSGGAPAANSGLGLLLILFAGMLAISGSGALVLVRKRIR